MATVREFMNEQPITVTPDTSVGDVAQLIGRTERTGVPVVDDDGRFVGIITEDDLVLSDDEGDLHIPHYIELFGGVVFLEPLQPLRGSPEEGVRLERARPDDDRHGHDQPRRPMSTRRVAWSRARAITSCPSSRTASSSA